MEEVDVSMGLAVQREGSENGSREGGRENAGELSGKVTKLSRGGRYQGATRPRKHCIQLHSTRKLEWLV